MSSWIDWFMMTYMNWKVTRSLTSCLRQCWLHKKQKPILYCKSKDRHCGGQMSLQWFQNVVGQTEWGFRNDKWTLRLMKCCGPDRMMIWWWMKDRYICYIWQNIVGWTEWWFRNDKCALRLTKCCGPDWMMNIASWWLVEKGRNHSTKKFDGEERNGCMALDEGLLCWFISAVLIKWKIH